MTSNLIHFSSSLWKEKLTRSLLERRNIQNQMNQMISKDRMKSFDPIHPTKVKLLQFFRKWKSFSLSKCNYQVIDQTIIDWRRYDILFTYFLRFKQIHRWIEYYASIQLKVEIYHYQNSMKRMKYVFRKLRLSILYRKSLQRRYWKIWKCFYQCLVWLRKFVNRKQKDAFLRLKRRSKWPRVIVFSKNNIYYRIMKKWKLWSIQSHHQRTCLHFSDLKIIQYHWKRFQNKRKQFKNQEKLERTAYSWHMVTLLKQFIYRLRKKAWKRLNRLTIRNYRRVYRARKLWSRYKRYISNRIFLHISMEKAIMKWKSISTNRFYLELKHVVQRKRNVKKAIRWHHQKFKDRCIHQMIKYTVRSIGQYNDLKSANRYYKMVKIRNLFHQWNLFKYQSKSYKHSEKKSIIYGREYKAFRHALMMFQKYVHIRRKLKYSHRKGYDMGYDKTSIVRWKRWYSIQQRYSLYLSVRVDRYYLKQRFQQFYHQIHHQKSNRYQNHMTVSKSYMYYRNSCYIHALLLWRYYALSHKRLLKAMRHQRLRKALTIWYVKIQSTIPIQLSMNRAKIRYICNRTRVMLLRWSSFKSRNCLLRRKSRVFQKLHKIPIFSIYRRIFLVWANTFHQRYVRRLNIVSYYRGMTIRNLWDRWDDLYHIRLKLRRTFGKFHRLYSKSQNRWQHIQMRYKYRTSVLNRTQISDFTIHQNLNSSLFHSSAFKLIEMNRYNVIGSRFRVSMDTLIYTSRSYRIFQITSYIRRIFKQWVRYSIHQKYERIAYKKAIEASFERVAVYSHAIQKRRLGIVQRLFHVWKDYSRKKKMDQIHFLQQKDRIELGKYFHLWKAAYRIQFVKKYIHVKPINSISQLNQSKSTDRKRTDRRPNVSFDKTSTRSISSTSSSTKRIMLKPANHSLSKSPNTSSSNGSELHDDRRKQMEVLIKPNHRIGYPNPAGISKRRSHEISLSQSFDFSDSNDSSTREPSNPKNRLKNEKEEEIGDDNIYSTDSLSDETIPSHIDRRTNRDNNPMISEPKSTDKMLSNSLLRKIQDNASQKRIVSTDSTIRMKSPPPLSRPIISSKPYTVDDSFHRKTSYSEIYLRNIKQSM